LRFIEFAPPSKIGRLTTGAKLKAPEPPPDRPDRSVLAAPKKVMAQILGVDQPPHHPCPGDVASKED